MSLLSMMTDSVTIVKPAYITDEFGDTIKDWTTATRINTKGWMSHGSTTEINGGQETSITVWRVYLKDNANVNRFDRIEYDGDTFEIQGKPIKAKRPGSTTHHIECTLNLIEG